MILAHQDFLNSRMRNDSQITGSNGNLQNAQQWTHKSITINNCNLGNSSSDQIPLASGFNNSSQLTPNQIPMGPPYNQSTFSKNVCHQHFDQYQQFTNLSKRSPMSYQSNFNMGGFYDMNNDNDQNGYQHT